MLPLSLVGQWELEMEKTLNRGKRMKILRFHSTKKKLDAAEVAAYDFVVTTPETGANNLELLT